MTDYCIQCTLPLRRCGSCQGVAGPFDRYCGFCGYELVRGSRRAPLWRLWLLAALVPLAAGLAIGVSPLAAPVSRGVQTIVRPTPPPGSTMTLRSDVLAFTYAIPREWIAADDNRASDPGRQIPFLVVTKVGGDQSRVLDARGDLLALRPVAATIEMGRPAPGSAGVDPTDPQAVLTFQVAQLLQAPPSGTRVDVVSPVHRITVNDRAGAATVLRLTRDGVSYDFERVWLPSRNGLFRVDALVPEPDWTAGDQQRVEDVVRSIRL